MLCLSDVVLYELLYGAERSNDPPRIRREVEDFTGRLTVLPFDCEAAAHTAEIRGDLERRDCVIGPYDLMIAGHARSRGLVVVTGDILLKQHLSRKAKLLSELSLSKLF